MVIRPRALKGPNTGKRPRHSAAKRSQACRREGREFWKHKHWGRHSPGMICTLLLVNTRSLPGRDTGSGERKRQTNKVTVWGASRPQQTHNPHFHASDYSD